MGGGLSEKGEEIRDASEHVRVLSEEGDKLNEEEEGI